LFEGTGKSAATSVREIVFVTAKTEPEAVLFQPNCSAYGIGFCLYIHLFLDYSIISLAQYDIKLEDDCE
jgi:hypothetical protein